MSDVASTGIFFTGTHNTDFHRKDRPNVRTRKGSGNPDPVPTLAILQRKKEKLVKTNRTEKMILSILTANWIPHLFRVLNIFNRLKGENLPRDSHKSRFWHHTSFSG